MNPSVATQIKRSNNLVYKMQTGTEFARSYFVYHVDFASVASAATATGSVTIQSDSHFLVHAITFSCFDVTTKAQITAPDSTLQILDTGSGNNLFDGPIELLNIAGTAQLPAILMPPRLFAPAANISLTLVNTNSTNNQKYQICFVGEKIFDFIGA